MSTTPTTTTAVATAAATVGVALLLRALKRSQSPEICCKLSCRCEQIQGRVCAKREDSIRIHCYCEDCRMYAKYIASLGNRPDETIGKPCGDSRVVQVCKAAVTIDKGEHLLKLAMKGPPAKGKLYMHRFYASCCSVPLFNTVSFLGFVGIFTDFLDEQQEKFDGPVSLFPESALVQQDPPLPDAFPPHFLWKLLRYAPWTKSGPFNYDMDPTYWGGGVGGGESKKDS